MKLLAQVIEQIEEAGVQIDKQTITGSRLALILMDNVIEILMYNLTKAELSFEDLEAIINDAFKDKYPDFNNKTQFVLSDDKISQDQKDILDICHSYRNEAYHQNIFHDGIIRQIVKLHFQICCEIIPNLHGRGGSFNYETDPIPSKYGISSYDILFSHGKLRELMKKISAGREYDQKEFLNSLALDIELRVKKACKDLKEIQSDQNYYKDFESGLKSFLSRAEKLKTKNKESNALNSYFKLDQDLLKIELNIDLISSYIDYETDLAVDRYREGI